MKFAKLLVIGVLFTLAGCASSGVPFVENLSTCDLPNEAICSWEAEAEQGVNEVIDYADSRVCVDIVTRCPTINGESVVVPCEPETCQSEPGVGDRVRREVEIRPPR